MDNLEKLIAESALSDLDARLDLGGGHHLQNLMLSNVPEFYIPPPPPTHEEINDYQSASVFMSALADSTLEWKKNLPEGYEPAILGLLYGGIQIHVRALAQVSFHGIRIEGSLNGSPCTMLAHQSTVQMLCVAQKTSPDKPKNTIGFVWDDNSIEV